VPTAGPNYGATMSTVAGAAPETAEAWLNPANAGTVGVNEAAITAATYDTPDVSQRLTAKGFGFAIPASATIDGITVEVSRRSIIANSGKDYRIQLLDEAGALVGDNKAVPATIWPSALAVATYGGAADTWNWATVTADKINDPDFGVVIACQANIANADVGVSYVRITVTYTEAPPTQTATAEISLASTTPPDTRTEHKLKVRARITNAAHQGTLRLRLYEGATPRSAELETSALTTAFADYTLSIADVDAAAITSYADLSIRLYGYSSGGTATVFEVSQLYLEAPATSGPAPIQRAISDTGAAISESIVREKDAFRTLSDTGRTGVDSLARGAGFFRALADTGAVISDAAVAGRGYGRAISDTGATVSDSVARSLSCSRPLTDAGAVVADAVVRTAARSRTLVDTGSTVVDSLAGGSVKSRTLADTGAAVTDALVRKLARALADTGAAVADSVRRSVGRRLADQGATVADTLVGARFFPRALSDTGAAVGDSIAPSLVRARPLAETGAAISDSLVRIAAHPRSLSDAGATVSDALLLVRRTTIALADTGMTAGGAAFSPDSITGLGGWFDASQLGLADGAGVTTWPDLSGLGRNLVAGTPTYRADVLNGLPVVRFDGVDDVLYTGLSASYRHIFVVAMHRLATFPDYDGLVGGVSWLVLTGDSGLARWYPYEPSSTTYHFDGVLAAGDWPAPMNSQFAVMSVSRHAGPWTMDFQVGQDRNVTGRNWDGDVAEVVAYDRVLSEAERQQVEGYLHDKWLGAGLLAVADSIVVTRVNARTLADTGAAVSDSITPTFTPGAVGFNRAVTDQGATVSDALSRTATHPRSATDTGAAISDAIARTAARLRATADTGATVSDSIALVRVRSRALVDTAVTHGEAIKRAITRNRVDVGVSISDSLVGARAYPRSMADTGAVVSDSITPKRLRAKVAADTGVALTDSIRVALARKLGDQGAAISDTLFVAAGIFLRSVSDTAVTASDVLRRSNVGRKLVDTGATVTDAPVVGAMHRLTDTGAAITDVVRVKAGRFMLDTGATVSDAVALTQARARVLSDTGTSVSDSIRRATARKLTDTGASVSDSVAAVRIALTFNRTAVDTGVALTDSLRRSAVKRVLTDTGASISDTPVEFVARRVGDTGAAISDVVTARRVRVRGAADTGAVVSDSLALTVVRSLVDQGALISDAPAGFVARRIGDVGAAISDMLVVSARRTVVAADTGTVVSDSITLTITRPIVDQGALVTDRLGIGLNTQLLSDTAVFPSDSLVATRLVPRALFDTAVTVEGDSITVVLSLKLTPPFEAVVFTRRTTISVADHVNEVRTPRHRDAQAILREDDVKPNARKLELVT
jgi:hypothetical protein